ncbi:MAG: hypothetical protein WKG01_30785 [Kofleriaceae bacterium]
MSRTVLARWSLFVAVVAACSKDAPPAIGDVNTSGACPTHLDLSLEGGQSRFDPGWTGGAHGVGIPQGSDATVELYDCDASCRRCKFRGPLRGDPAIKPVVGQRCLAALSKTCTTDAECAGAGPCRMMFPPIASKISTTPTCALAYFEPIAGPEPSPMQGVFDFETGELDMTVLNIFINISIGACARCTGEDEPFDDVAEGTCDNAPATKCDIHGRGTTLPSTTSYDCPRPAALFTIKLPGDGASTATREWTMDASRPKCTVGGDKPCWCGMCADGKSCIANRDCADNRCNAVEGPPMQGSALTPYNIDNNACATTCNWDPTTQRGTCNDATAAPCYPDTGKLIARGSAEVFDGYYISKIANLVCMPAFGGVPDQVGGYPGPFIYEAAFRITPRTVR